MRMTLRSCWLRFSIRTVLVVTTIISAWLAWNLHRVQEHNRIAILLLAANGTRGTNIVAAWDADDEVFKADARHRLPFMWSLLGALPVDSINLDPNEYTESDLGFFSRLFPEAYVSRATKR